MAKEETTVTQEKRRDRKTKEKLLSGFSHFKLMMTERRKIGHQNYFSNLSPKLLLTITFIFSIFILSLLEYYNVFTREANYYLKENISLIFYMAMVLAVFAGLLLFKPEFLNKILIWIVVLIIGLFSIEYFLRNDIVSLFFTAAIGFSLGLILLSIFYDFFLEYSTPERFVTLLVIIGLFVSIGSIGSLINDLLNSNLITSYVLPVFFLVLSIVILILLKVKYNKEEVLPVQNEKINRIPFIFLISIIFIVFVNYGLIEGIGNVFESSYPEIIESYPFEAPAIGVLAGLIISYFLFTYSNKALSVSNVLYLAILLLTYQFGIFYYLYAGEFFDGARFLLWLFLFFSSCSTTYGFIFVFILSGKIADDNQSSNIIKVLMLFLGSYFIGSKFLQRYAESFDLINLKDIISVLMAFTVVIFFILIILDIRRLLESNKKAPVEEIASNVAEKKYKYIDPEVELSKKEMKVFRLLIEGYSLKQIAEQLECKYDAVNFHYKNIYRKLDVNTKLELILRYGNDKK